MKSQNVDMSLFQFRLSMTTIIRASILLLILGNSFVAFAQSKISSKSQQPSYTIEDARNIIDTDPQQAVIILNGIINSKRRDRESLSEAYELLGDINTKNNLFPQSIDRYQKALSSLSKKSSREKRAELNYKIGQSFLQLTPSSAGQYFDNCMSIDSKGSLYYPCLEGIADGSEAIDSLDQALKIYTEIEKSVYGQNKSNLSRIQAKIATILAKQKKLDQALDVYNVSQSNYFPGNADNDKASKSATNTIIQNQQNVSDEITLRSSNVTTYGEKRELVAEERIQLAEAYVKSGNTNKALEELRRLRPEISILPESIRADYFKKNSEIYTLRGNYKSALENFEQYEKERDLVLDKREADLNNRLAINDLQSFVDLSEKEFENEQDRDSYTESLSMKKNWIIYLLIALLIGALLSTFFIYRNVQAKKKANQLLELRSLRSEMNPHFIFNALGSVNEFIATQEPRKANRFLADFSTLMRNAMEMNKRDLIPLQEELQFSELYLKLEHARWSEKFDYEIDIDYESLDSDYLIPPLLIQPYIENAIWHGLRYKEEHGLLSFKLIKSSVGEMTIVIQDNGIGRKKSQESKTRNQMKYASTGMRNTNKRAILINQLYEKKLNIDIRDLYRESSDTGTIVEVKLN